MRTNNNKNQIKEKETFLHHAPSKQNSPYFGETNIKVFRSSSTKNLNQINFANLMQGSNQKKFTFTISKIQKGFLSEKATVSKNTSKNKLPKISSERHIKLQKNNSMKDLRFFPNSKGVGFILINKNLKDHSNQKNYFNQRPIKMLNQGDSLSKSDSSANLKKQLNFFTTKKLLLKSDAEEKSINTQEENKKIEETPEKRKLLLPRGSLSIKSIRAKTNLFMKGESSKPTEEEKSISQVTHRKNRTSKTVKKNSKDEIVLKSQIENLLLSFNPQKSDRKVEFMRNFCVKSQAGKQEEGTTKVNQDSYLIANKINDINDFNMFGVLDGHGYNGHLVSQFVSEYIRKSIEKNEEIKELKNIDKIYEKLREDNYRIIKGTFMLAEEELKSTSFDCNFSGTTCVIVFQIGKHLICANTGDSRAIIISGGGKGKYEVKNLSFDHKPDKEHEKKRIKKCGGRVEQYCEFGVKAGPYRVWLKEESYPGLAMSRSIGDLVASNIGVIPEPEIVESKITNSTKYMVIASDGVWEFLKNERVMKISNKFYEKNDINGLCNEIIKESTKWWEKEDVVIDDITTVVVFF